MVDLGKLFIFIGIGITLLGLFLTFGGSIPFLGKLPGDIYIKRDSFSFYFPVVTCILVSIVVTLILKLFNR
jgi:hypothetical protein